MFWFGRKTQIARVVESLRETRDILQSINKGLVEDRASVDLLRRKLEETNRKHADLNLP